MAAPIGEERAQPLQMIIVRIALLVIALLSGTLGAGCDEMTPQRYCALRDAAWERAYAGDRVLAPLRDRDKFFVACEKEMARLEDNRTPSFTCRVACLREHAPAKHATRKEAKVAFMVMNRCDAEC